jgi:hypothetical protein
MVIYFGVNLIIDLVSLSLSKAVAGLVVDLLY